MVRSGELPRYDHIASLGFTEGDKLSVIGQRMRKVDGLAKATGQARYTDDIELPEMLHVIYRVLFSKS